MCKVSSNIEDSQNQFCQIVIDDSAGLPGSSLIQILMLILQHVPAKWIVIEAVECGGEMREELMAGDPSLDMPVTELMTKASSINQFDWGDFFLFEDEQRAKSNLSRIQHMSNTGRFESLIRESLATIRAVDGGYLYLYTRIAPLVNAVANTYANCKVKRGKLENLNFPW